ncbi:MAG: hypothetical protein K9G62_06275 [Alphaproteobacteria bacterium]|nr:hypothetical protein [Alphaproteobacteria bacterium]
MATETIIGSQKTQIAFYSRTSDAWTAMYDDCVKAQKSIEFEQYILRDDEIGQRFMMLFAKKAKEGLTIRVLLDRVGSRDMYGSKIVQDIKDHGGAIEFYNPINWLNLFVPTTWFPRNHTKTMLIDSRIAHIGSVCLASYMADWRDLHARISGVLVDEITQDFSHIWKRTADRTAVSRDTAASGDPDFDYLIARPHLTPSPIYRQLLAQIHSAKEHIYMATPYFLPPYGLRQALCSAAQRGVDVRVILTEQTDVPLAIHVSRSYFPRLLKKGLRIFSYKGTVFHAKYSIVDGKWATMGSVNLDYLSLLENREANIVITRHDAVQNLKKQFYGDLENCDEIDSDFWKKIPLHYKIIGYLGRSVKRMI